MPLRQWSQVQTMLLGALILAGLGGLSAQAWEPEVRWHVPGLVEPSGLVISRQHEDLLWTLNDSGGGPELFALRFSGALVGRVRVKGADNRDWESIAIDDKGRLYIGDFGDNRSDRRDLTVYVVKEPDPTRDRTVKVEKRVRFSFRDRDEKRGKNGSAFDVEASFFGDERLHILTKERGTARTSLYRFKPLRHKERQKLRAREIAPVDALVTGAELHPDQLRLAILTYDSIIVYQRAEPGTPFFSEPPQYSRIEVGQAEGIAWDGEDLLVCNEQLELHRIPPSIWRDSGRYLPPLPAPLSIRPVGADGAPLTQLPLRWSRPGQSSPPRQLPEGGPRPRALIGWSQRGLVLDLHWPSRPAREKDESIAILMTTAKDLHPGPCRAEDRAWFLRWRGAGSAPAVVATGSGKTAVDPNVVRLQPAPGGFSLRVSIPAAALSQWQGESGAAAGFNVILLGPEEEGQWCFSADASTFCWTTPDLWGELRLEEEPS